MIDGAIYLVSTDGYVHAVDAETGHLLWKHWTNDDLFHPATALGDMLCLGSGAHVYALKAATGELLWSREMDLAVYHSPVVAQDAVYISSYTGPMYAIDARTGEEIWKYEREPGPSAKTSDLGTVEFERFSPPAVVEGKVYIGTESGYVLALNASSGKVMWQFEAASRVVLPPVIGAGIVYAGGSFGGLLQALDSSSGELVWQYNPGNGVRSLELNGGLLFVDGYDDYLYALDPATGEPRWRTSGDPLFSPMVSDGVVYAKDPELAPDRPLKGIFALDASTGEILWTYYDDIGLGSRAALAEGVVYVTPTEHYYDSKRGYTGRYLYAVTTPGGG